MMTIYRFLVEKGHITFAHDSKDVVSRSIKEIEQYMKDYSDYVLEQKTPTEEVIEKQILEHTYDHDNGDKIINPYHIKLISKEIVSLFKSK